MFTLPPLPFADSALEPHVSERTMQLHHGAHHKAYVDKLNALIAGTPLEQLTLEEIITSTKDSAEPERKKIFNNAGQHWNHSFFWNSLLPGGGGVPGGELATEATETFGSENGLYEALLDQGTNHFGSGWVWLVLSNGKLEVCTTHDGDTPIAHGMIPLVTCDLWEHAYYLDHQNRRPEFLKAWLNHLVNWEFAEANLASARGAA